MPTHFGKEAIMVTLQQILITFNTHGDDKDSDTVLHVFVKNRSNTSSTPEQATDYISNLLAYNSYETMSSNVMTWEKNPYLGFARNLAPGLSFDDPSGNGFEIPLRGAPIPLEEIILPVVNIHILPNGDDTWMFDYFILFIFSDGSKIEYSSNNNGMTGIILDQNNRNYSGICSENTMISIPAPPKPDAPVVLTGVTLGFATHDHGKKSDTVVNVHIVNRLGASASQDIAIGLDLLAGENFQTPSTNWVFFPSSQLQLASNDIKLQDIVLPVVFINIVPNSDDKWNFDFQVTYSFKDGRNFTSRTSGVILNQDYHKCECVYQGPSFPVVQALPKPALMGPAINQNIPFGVPTTWVNTTPKVISLDFLRAKLVEFFNNRLGVGSEDPPVAYIELNNAGVYGGTPPEGYYDLQTIVANPPPPPGTLSPPGFEEGITYVSNPVSLGSGGPYFNNLRSQVITSSVDGTQPAPITIEVVFDCSTKNELQNSGDPIDSSVDFLSFSIALKLTLTNDPTHGKVDAVSWVSDINNLVQTPNAAASTIEVSGSFLGQPVFATLPFLGYEQGFGAFKDQLLAKVIIVNLVTSKARDPHDDIVKAIRGDIFSALTTPDPFDGTTTTDSLNSTLNSILLGGVVDPQYQNRCIVEEVQVTAEELLVAYAGPRATYVPPVPPGLPNVTPAMATTDFSPGSLSNIDHIVILTMENRSFDQMLGYLSLPPEKGGMGRTDVDGLKGNEVNYLGTTPCPSFPFPTEDTIFFPDPPHGFDPVHKAINGGKMDGFVASYAEAHGPGVAKRVMGYHTPANVPVYDALARDFAICHRWFAPHPGPTFCNRFYELTGRLNIDPDGFWEFDNSSHLIPSFTPTIFDYLTAQNVSWKYFEHHYTFLRFFERHTFNATNIATFDDPEFGFANTARTGSLPSVTFIDPHFIELPPGGNCDGPPADVKDGQILVRQVVEAVVASPTWAKTLLIIVSDEHGGFYDHVAPPAATPAFPDGPATFGVRIPAFFISPWIPAGAVFGHDGLRALGVGGGETRVAPLQSLYFDHTSILKTIARRFMSENPPDMGPRYVAANDLTAVVGATPRQTQFLPFIPYNFVCAASQKRLDVQSASVTPGTVLWQYDPNDTVAQQFSFEDAGGGFVYIRTFTANLYLTAEDSLGIIQDVRYPTDGSATAANNPDRQRWLLSSNSVSVLDKSNYTVSNAAFPGKVLQPSGDSANSGVLVVLGDAQATNNVLQTPNPWNVTSPRLSTGVVQLP